MTYFDIFKRGFVNDSVYLIYLFNVAFELHIKANTRHLYKEKKQAVFNAL